MQFWITLAILRAAIRRYGIVSTVMRHQVRAKHAAMGRATRTVVWARAHGLGATGNNLMARDLIARLRLERNGEYAVCA